MSMIFDDDSVIGLLRSQRSYDLAVLAIVMAFEDNNADAAEKLKIIADNSRDWRKELSKTKPKPKEYAIFIMKLHLARDINKIASKILSLIEYIERQPGDNTLPDV